MVAGSFFSKIFRRSETVPISADQPKNTVKNRKRTWRGFVRDLTIYFLTYLFISGLTIGPMFWTWYGAMYADGPKWIARFYFPLAFLCEICPPLARLINAWINWWIL